jgi:hypothetical protein
MDTIEDTDKDLLSSALSDEPPAAAEAPQAEAEPAQPRDDQGRFAPKTEEAQPEPTPVQTQPPVAEPQQAPLTADTQPQDHRVPLRELLDEREKRQDAARQLADRDQRIDYLTRLISQAQQQSQQQPGPQQPPADIWSDPDAYLNGRINPLAEQARDAIQQVKESTSRILATDKYGEEVVNTAFSELARQMQTGQGQFDYQRIMASQHPYGELVKWHKAQTNLKAVGDDPNAWLEKQLEAKMNDPAFQAKVIQLAQQQQQQPSNGSGRPAPISLPPSLSRTPAAMGVVADDSLDESDAALLSSALRRK